jgi:hypothetical protein
MGFDYSQLKSGITRRGEELFPFACFKEKRDWAGILEELEAIKIIDKENGEG